MPRIKIRKSKNIDAYTQGYLEGVKSRNYEIVNLVNQVNELQKQIYEQDSGVEDNLVKIGEEVIRLTDGSYEVVETFKNIIKKTELNFITTKVYK